MSRMKPPTNAKRGLRTRQKSSHRLVSDILRDAYAAHCRDRVTRQVLKRMLG